MGRGPRDVVGHNETTQREKKRERQRGIERARGRNTKEKEGGRDREKGTTTGQRRSPQTTTVTANQKASNQSKFVTPCRECVFWCERARAHQLDPPQTPNAHANRAKNATTFNGGSLGSCTDEERCELRYVMRIAQLSESSKF